MPPKFTNPSTQAQRSTIESFPDNVKELGDKLIEAMSRYTGNNVTKLAHAAREFQYRGYSDIPENVREYIFGKLKMGNTKPTPTLSVQDIKKLETEWLYSVDTQTLHLEDEADLKERIEKSRSDN